MVKAKRVLSMALASVFTAMTLLTMPAQAAPKKVTVVPAKITVVDGAADEYQPNDPVEVVVKAANTKAKVQYRVSLVNAGKRVELYSKKTKFFGPALNGKLETTLKMKAFGKGTAAMLVYAKAVGSTKVYDSVASFKFVVQPRPEEVEPTQEPTPEVTVDPNAAAVTALEDAVKAYEAAPITTLEEIAKAEALKPAQKLLDDVKDEAAKKPLVDRIAAMDKKIADKKAELTPAKVDSATVTGAKKITVKFNKAVDTTKVTFGVKKATIQVNVASTTWNEAKTEAILNFPNALPAGDYVVAVSGVEAAAVEKTVTVEAEKVAKIEFASTSAVMDRAHFNVVSVDYSVLNQYGEKYSNATLVFSTSKGNPDYTTKPGTLILTSSTGDYVLGEKVTVSVLHADTATFTSAVLNVVPKSMVAEVSISKLYNADGKTLNVLSTVGDFKLVVEGKDQYGNVVSAADLAADVIVSVSSPTVASVGSFIYDADLESVVLPLAGTLSAGTTKVTIIAKATGKSASYDVAVTASAKVDTLTLTAPALAVAGEEFEVPFTAVDQFGKDVTSLSLLSVFNQGGTNPITATGLAAGKVYFTRDYVKGVNKLMVDTEGLTAATTIVLIASTPSGKVVQLPISLVAPAKPVVVSGFYKVAPVMAQSDVKTAAMGSGNIIAKDQYGRTIKLNADYKYSVETSNASVLAISGAEVTSTTGITLAPKAKGSATLKVALVKVADGKTVDNSALTFGVSVVENDSYTNYELGSVAKIYSGADRTEDHDQALTVYGVMADGTKVALPVEDFEVNVIGQAGLQFTTAGAIAVTTNTGIACGDTHEKNVTVIVTLKKSSVATQVLTGTVTLTDSARTVAEVILDEDSDYFVEGNVVALPVNTINTQTGVETMIKALTLANDQYGVGIDAKVTRCIVTNLPAGYTLATVTAGQTFNVIVITESGKVLTVKVVVDAAQLN